MLGTAVVIIAWGIATAISVGGWSTSRRSSSTASLYSTIVGSYVDPPPLADPIAIRENDGSERTLRGLRAVRIWAKQQEENNPAWPQKSSAFDIDNFPPEDRAAYLIANSVNDLGSAAFTGGLPLGTITGTVGDVIIDDWLTCRHWVAEYRRRENVLLIADSAISYHRRYGEWLAMLCFVLFKNKWGYKPAARLAAMIEVDAEQRLTALTRADKDAVPLHVAGELLRLLPYPLNLRIFALCVIPGSGGWRDLKVWLGCVLGRARARWPSLRGKF